MPVVPATAGQRSHVLLVLSSPLDDRDDATRHFLSGAFADELAALPGVLGVAVYEHDELDVTHGRYPRLPYRFLTIVQLGIDGGEEASEVIDAVRRLHFSSGVAAEPATWLYFPVSERAGDLDSDGPGVVLAFANGLAGREDEFREWYSTGHIRHALYIPALAHGQCFERTGWQDAGAAPADFHLIAIYGLRGTAQEFLDAIDDLDRSLIVFPTLDRERFSESAFTRLARR